MSPAKSRSTKGTIEDISIRTSKNPLLFNCGSGLEDTPIAIVSRAPCLDTSAELDCQQLSVPQISNLYEHITEADQLGSDDVTQGTNEPDRSFSDTVRLEPNNSKYQPRTQRLNISQITQNTLLQSRIKMDPSTVENYAENYRNGEDLPYPDVFEIDGLFYLVDGFHRLAAVLQERWTEIDCVVHKGNMRDALLFASGVNATHGLPRTNADKRHIVEKVLYDEEWREWSDNEIATICRVSHTFVAKVRKNVTCNVASESLKKKRTYTTKHGTSGTMDTTHIGKQTITVVQKPLTPHCEIPSETPDFPITVMVPKTTIPEDIGAEMVTAISDRGIVDFKHPKSTIKQMSSDEIQPEKIADKLVQHLSYPQRTFLQKIIKKGEAETNLDAISTVIDFARVSMDGWQ